MQGGDVALAEEVAHAGEPTPDNPLGLYYTQHKWGGGGDGRVGGGSGSGGRDQGSAEVAVPYNTYNPWSYPMRSTSGAGAMIWGGRGSRGRGQATEPNHLQLLLPTCCCLVAAPDGLPYYRTVQG